MVECCVDESGCSCVRWLMKIWQFLFVGMWLEDVWGVVISFLFLSSVMLLWMVVVEMLNECWFMMDWLLMGLWVLMQFCMIVWRIWSFCFVIIVFFFVGIWMFRVLILLWIGCVLV